MNQIFMAPFLLFLILMPVSSLFQSCSDFFCKFCPSNYYNIFYAETFKMSFMNATKTNNACIEKLNVVALSRKIFILNDSSTFLGDKTSYDFTYKNLAIAFENETRVLSNYSQGILEIVLQNGYHKINENDFSTTFGEFFRRITVSISIFSEKNNEFSIVEIKTNTFHIFVSSSFLIKNIKFVGNDLVLSSPSNTSCQEADFSNDYISQKNMSNSACFLNNRVINVITRLNYYGFLNIEDANSFNSGILANLTIFNCEFYNFFPLNLDGSNSLISLAPLSGTLNMQNVVIDNSLFPQGIIYYSLYDFDSLYSSLTTDMITKYFKNCSQNVLIQNITLKRYNFYETISGMELFLMSFTDFIGDCSITESSFVQIFNISALIQVSKINKLILSNCKFHNLSELSILKSRQSNMVFLDFVEISFCFPTENLFFIDTNMYFEITSSNFSNIFLNMNRDCFFVTNSIFSYQDSLIFRSSFKSFISQSGINLNISNLTFQNIQFSEYLISFSGNYGVIIQNSCFSNITGNLYFFVLSKSSFIIIFDSLLYSINIYSFFYALNSQLNLISRNVFKNNYFSYFWEKDFFASNVIADEIFLFENTIAISIVRCFYQSLLFTMRDFFVLENQFIQLSAGGMVQMQNGDLLFQRVKLIDNDFTNTITFSFLFELSIEAIMVFDESIIKDTGITQKKKKYLVFSDNVFFSVWYAPYTLFQNSLLMATDQIEIASGFVSATPHGGIFEFINNTLILQVSENTTFDYKGLLLDHFLVAYLCNNTFYNMRCQPTAFSTINGGICLLASSSYTFNKGQNDYSVFMRNNSFYNSTCIEGGGLAIIGIKTIVLTDCYFYNSITQDKGGSFLIAGSENCTISNILINSSKATLGGAAFFQNILELDMNNITLIDVSTNENGVLFFNNIDVLNLNILFTNQTLAGMNGGVIYLKYVDFSMQNGSVFNSVALKKGGFLICDGRSVVSIENLKIHNSSSSQGGVIYILNADNLNISNFLVKKSFSFISGAIISVDHSKFTFFQNFIFINSSCDGNGMILFKEDDDNTAIFINRLICINNSAVDGSCLLFSSASYLILENFFAENNVNTPLVLMGLISNHVDAKNLVINKTQTKDDVIYMNNIEISAQNLFCFENMLYEQLLFGFEIIGNLDQSVFVKNGNGTSIYIKGSDFLFKNFTFQNTSANVLILDGESSNIKFASSKITEGNTLTADKPLLYIFNSNFSAINTTFRNNKALVFLISNSILIFFDMCQFQNNQNKENSIPNDIYIQNSLLGFYTNVIISNTIFEIAAGYSCDFSKSNITNLTRATFKNLDKEILAQGINIETNLKIVISQCYFMNFTQGAVRINNAYLPSIESILEISFSRFSFNQAAKGGALFLQGSMKISLISSSFENNKAIASFGNDKNELQGVGGCVFFKAEHTKNSPMKIFNSSFTENAADFIGPTVFSQILVQNEQGSGFFKKNFDGSNVTKQMISYPLELSILSVFSEGNETSNPKISDVITFNSGTPFKIQIQITDFFKQRLSFDNSSVLYWKKTDNQNNFTVNIENNLNTSSQGIVIFDLILVRVKPNTSFSLNTQGEFLGITKDVLPTVLNQAFNFYSRVCLTGEIILPDFSCFKCLPKTFSLNDPMHQDQKFQKCSPCPNNCECFGGSNISPLPGYYRYSNLSVVVVACLTPKACLGYQNINRTADPDDSSYIHGQCLSGNSGPLCDKCDYFYGKYDKGDTCLPCASLTSLVVVRVVGYLFLTSLYLYFNSYLVESYTEEKKQSEMEIFFKLIINHTQQVNVILSSGVVLPLPEIKKFFSYTDYFSTTNDHVYTNECVAQNILQSNYLNLNLLKIVLNSFLPLLLSLVTFPIWVGYVFMKQKYYSTNVRSRVVDINFSFVISKIVLFVVISVFILYPLIVQSCFRLFQCYSLDPNLNTVFVKEDLEVECWGTTHIRNILLFSFPGLVIWGFGFPIFIFWKIKLYLKLRTSSYLVSSSFQASNNKKSWKSGTDLQKSTQKLNNYKVFAFYYKGYKSEFYYWESLILMRKLFICFVSSLTESIKSEYKWMLFLVIFFFCLYVTQKKMPFTLMKGNILEIFSLSCIIFTIASCFIIESSTYSALQTGSAIITFMMHIFFFVYIIYHICLLLYATLKIKREALKTIAQQKIKLKMQTVKSKK